MEIRRQRPSTLRDLRVVLWQSWIRLLERTCRHQHRPGGASGNSGGPHADSCLRRGATFLSGRLPKRPSTRTNPLRSRLQRCRATRRRTRERDPLSSTKRRETQSLCRLPRAKSILPPGRADRPETGAVGATLGAPPAEDRSGSVESDIPPVTMVPVPPSRIQTPRSPLEETPAAIVLPLARSQVRGDQTSRVTMSPKLAGLDRLLRVAAARGASTLSWYRVRGPRFVSTGKSVCSKARPC